MILNYLRVAFRGLLKNKTYFVINTFGLGISLACCITAYLLLAFNIEFDNFHDDKKVSHIFKIHTLSTEKTGKHVIDNQAPIIMAPIAAEEIAGISRYARFLYGGGAISYKDKAFNEGIAFTDSSFFDMFDYPLLKGSHKSFKEKNSIFLSEELAKKYFGNEDPVGKIMVLSSVNESEIEMLVGGVMKRIPANNTFSFDALMRIENFMEINQIKIDDWSDWRNPATFVQLVSPGNAEDIGKKFDRYIPIRNKARTDMVVDAYRLEPFKSNFTQDDIRYNWANLRISALPLVVFTSMAGLILLIACFNLTNTSIAMTAKRLKEVGVRKAIGAARSQIVSQFLLETIITISMALVAGLLMAQVIVPAFVNMWKLPYNLKDLSGVNLFITLIMLVFLTSLLAGIYPALFSSKFKPTALLKGTVQIKGTNFLTRTLVALQFAMSVIVLIGGVVFIQNTKYQDDIQFGYDKDMLITVALKGDREYEAMKAAIATNPKILSVGVSDGNIGSSNYQTPVKVDTGQYDVQAAGIGINYFETVGLKLVMGRAFDLNNANDQNEGAIVNRAFVEKTGLTDPIEKIVILHDQRRVIIGVVENHVDNLYRSKEMEPFIFYPTTRAKYVNLVVKTEHENLPEIQKYLEGVWKELYPTKPFESKYQEDLVMAGSRELNANLEKIFLFITLLGGLLSASGIFALASLNVAKRTKEIGIRKALGASVNNIVGLLNREFAIILIVAVIMGSVGGYFLTAELLGQIYKYHIPVGLIPVILCAAGIFGMGIFTTSATILKAAKTNPVDTLRSE